MFEEIITTLSNGVQNIDILIANHIDMNKNSQHEDELVAKLDKNHIYRDENSLKEKISLQISKVITWEQDEILKQSIINMKESAQLLSNNCIKFALLVKTNPKPNALHSLIKETSQYIVNFIQYYFDFLKSSYSFCLFDDISRLIRSMLAHNKDLFMIIQSSAYKISNIHDSINYQTGMILKIKEEIDKFPLDNKQAYRRLFMQQCLLIKETIQEFKEYINEAKEKLANPMINEENETSNKVKNIKNEEDDDDDNDELDYTEIELKVVETCVEVMSKCLGCIKQSIPIITTISDHINQLHQDMLANTNTIQNNNSTISSDTIINNNNNIKYKYMYCSQWVCKLAYQAKILNHNVLDLGVELYPPFEKDLEQIQDLYHSLKLNSIQYINLIINNNKEFNIYNNNSNNNDDDESKHKMIQFLNELQAYNDQII